jgi:hypothetical protein
MSGKIGDNLGTSSGLVKSATDAPSTGSSNPGTDENPSAVGDRFINTTSGELFVCTSATTDQNTWEGQLDTSVLFLPFIGGRGVWCGGETSDQSDVIDYLTISSLGNATDFGDLTTATGTGGAVSNGTRCVYGGGEV